MTLWMVIYKVRGQAGHHAAGPYSDHELEFKRHDIATYAGVHDVRVELAPEVAARPGATDAVLP